MTAEQQERINAAVKAWAEKWHSGQGYGEAANELCRAWRAAQTPKWCVIPIPYSGSGSLGSSIRCGPRAFEPFTGVEARAVCDALNALAESEART